MPSRITHINDLLFPVREVPLFAELRAGEQRSLIRVSGRKAIVDCTTDQVLGVVSDNYRLVTNRDALEYAFQCCEAAFPDLSATEWDPCSADAPGTRGHCHIDLQHRTAHLDFKSVAAKDRPDTYGPFVRVTNSYNGTRALRFDIGFMRKVCENGLILPQSSIRFSFDHNTRQIADRVRLRTSNRDFKTIKSQFQAFLAPLHGCPLSLERIRTIAMLALGAREPEEPTERQMQAWEVFKDYVGRLSKRYKEETGANGYALLNVITDLATRPGDAGRQLVRRDRHSLQRLAGTWMASFSKECQETGFNPDAYVKQLKENAGPPKARRTRRARSGIPFGNFEEGYEDPLAPF